MDRRAVHNVPVSLPIVAATGSVGFSQPVTISEPHDLQIFDEIVTEIQPELRFADGARGVPPRAVSIEVVGDYRSHLHGGSPAISPAATQIAPMRSNADVPRQPLVGPACSEHGDPAGEVDVDRTASGWVWERCSNKDLEEIMQKLTVRDACPDQLLPVVTPDTKLTTVVEELQGSPCVVLHSAESERLLPRRLLLLRILATGVCRCSLAHWLAQVVPRHGLAGVPEPPRVRDSATLHSVMPLLTAGAEELAVENGQGRVVGVVGAGEVLGRISAEAVAQSRRHRSESGVLLHTSNSVKRDIRFGGSTEDADDHALPAQPAALHQRFGVPHRAVAAAEAILAVLLLVDVVLAVTDMVLFSPCVHCAEEWPRAHTRSDNKEQPFLDAQDCEDRLGLLACETTWTLSNPFTTTMAALAVVFFLESLVTLYAIRHTPMQHSFALADCLLIWGVLGASGWLLFGEGDQTVRQVLAVVRVVRLVRCCRKSDDLRQFIGKEKSRYQANGFDLDLCYVTESCIAMSLPASGFEAKYRNPADEVARFFRTMHSQSDAPRYLVVNLCSERQYSPQLFDGNVACFPTDDHNPCLLEQMCLFVERCEQFMLSHPDNVIAVHCKGGKGRTGLMVCCWLLHCGFFGAGGGRGEEERVAEALEWFAKRRTGRNAKKAQTVQQPSQRRYLRYFCRTIQTGGYLSPVLCLRKIVLHSTPNMDADGGCDPWFVIEQKWKEVFDYSKCYKVEHVERGRERIELDCGNVELRGDVRISFFDHDEMPPRDEKMFFLWFHTGFVEENHLRLGKRELDGACKDTKCKVYREEFVVELFFQSLPHSTCPHRKLQPAPERMREEAEGMRRRMQTNAQPNQAFTRLQSESFKIERP